MEKVFSFSYNTNTCGDKSCMYLQVNCEQKYIVETESELPKKNSWAGQLYASCMPAKPAKNIYNLQFTCT